MYRIHREIYVLISHYLNNLNAVRYTWMYVCMCLIYMLYNKFHVLHNCFLLFKNFSFLFHYCSDRNYWQVPCSVCSQTYSISYVTSHLNQSALLICATLGFAYECRIQTRNCLSLGECSLLVTQ